MKEYIVTWSMPIDAETPEDAAAQALGIVSDPANVATWFRVEAVDGTYSQMIDAAEVEVDF